MKYSLRASFTALLTTEYRPNIIISITITANQVMITVEDTTLSEVSEIVAKLEDDEKTAYVTVSTAGTDEGEKRAVSADIMVQLKNGGEKDE